MAVHDPSTPTLPVVMPIPHHLFSRIFGALAAILLLSSSALAQSYTSYDLIVPTSPPTGPATIIDGTGRLMPSNRSFIIGVEGGVRSTLVFTNWTAVNPNYPVIIVNQHGTGRVVIKDDGVTYRDGIRLDNCSFIKLLGNNDPAHRYGFEVAQAGRMPAPGVSRISRLGVSVGATSTNVEVAFIEVHHTGFAGIMAKTDPQLSKPETWAANYTMYDLSIHDCYVHDAGGEGMYIGYTGWATDHWPEVPGFESHEILGLKVYNNLIERTAWDGFQIASAPDPDTTAVYNNVVIQSGLSGEAGQSNGVQIGAGGAGRFHDNIIIDSVGNNLAMFGVGYNAIYNNLFIEGDNGIFADNRPNPPPADSTARQTIPGTYYSFYNNTIINPNQNAFWSMSEVNVTNFKNNVSLVPNPAGTDALAQNGAVINAAGNLLLRTPEDANFADPANYDYRILPGSAAIDIGVSLAAAEFPVTTDIEGNARPQGSAYDAGISEAGALSVFLIATPPPATAGGTGSVNASTIGGTPPYTYAWSNGATTASITGVPEGLYQVTVTDAVGAQRTRATYLIPGALLGAPVGVTPSNQVFAPAFDAPPGTYLTGQTVALTSATPGAAIRYTTDGTNPSDTAGTLYSTPIAVDNTVTLKAVAYKAGLVNSTVETATYIIDNGPPNTKLTIVAVSESEHTSTNVAANAIDGNLGTSWASNGDGEWLQLDLGVPSRIGFLNIAVPSATARSYYYDLQASNDGFNWATILTGGRTPLNAGLQKHDIGDVQPVRYLRIVTHGSTYSPTLNNIAEIEVWGGPVTDSGGEPPATPPNLAATGGDAVVTLDWDASTGANSYNVKRATTSGGPYETVAAGVATTNFMDTSVTNGTTYYYVVTGVNLYGASGDSNEAVATPQGVPPVPSANISAAPADGHVVVSWSATAKTDTYNLKRATTAGGPYTTIAADLTATVFADVGLTNGTTYYYVVSGVNVDGEGANSAEASATPQAGYPGVLHILTPIDWGAATGSGYCPATYAFDGQPTWDNDAQQPVGISLEPHQTTLTGYANRFWFMDFGPDFATLRITQMWTRYRPNSPGDYQGFAFMWWDDDKDITNDGVIAPNMNFSAGGVLPNVNPQLWVRDRDFTATPITPQGRYLVVSTGPTVSSRPNEFAFVGYRDVAAPPAPPTGVAAIAVTTAGDAQVALNWSASPGATSYNIKRATGGGSYVALATGVTGTNYTDSGLTDGTTYHYVVSAVNDRGESADSATASATADATPPELSLPDDLTIEATSASGAVANFTISATDAISSSVTTTADPASGTVFPLGTTTVNVSAIDSAGNTSTGSFTVTVQDTTAPAIEQLTASETSLWPPNHKLVAVTLAATVTDAVDPSPVTRIISVTSNEPVEGEGSGSTSPDWVITGDLSVQLRAERAGGGSGRVYTITVESRDASGNASVQTVLVTVPHDNGT